MSDKELFKAIEKAMGLQSPNLKKQRSREGE
jgi:hypothetical protein